MAGTGFRALAGKLVGDRLVAPELLPRLDAVRDRAGAINARIEASRETEALLNGFAGGHLPAGPSGVLTRGREDILPTGRNFFSLDPRRTPTKAAAMVGRSLAEAMLAKYLAEEGRYPHNIAIYWMANDIMWADGEAMGQIMHLLGVRPRWEADGRVSRFDIVPLAELKRPRVDVTIRASGLIRDNFPDRLEYLDDVIAAVAALDEPEEDNFVRAHALATLRQEGASPDDRDALRRASLRIFSARPAPTRPESTWRSTPRPGRPKATCPTSSSTGTASPTAGASTAARPSRNWPTPCAPSRSRPTRWSRTSTTCSAAAAISAPTAA